jgi:lipid-A-disaccharide synthase
MSERGGDVPGGHILMVAGEPSGDHHGADLAKALKDLFPRATLWGMGGDSMAREGVEIRVHMADIAVVGLVEVIGHLGPALRARRTLLRAADAQPPTLAILIDCPDFNLRLARALKRRGIPLLYYISPQVWAWRRGRLKVMVRLLDRVAVILPFEEPFLRDAGIAAEYVGHPLVEQIDGDAAREEAARSLELPPDVPILGLLPGSRPREVETLLPVMLEGLRLVKEAIGAFRAILALSPLVARASVEERIRLAGVPVQVVQGRAQQVIRASRMVLVASGTATLEAALLETPMVVVYRTSWISYLVGRLLVKVRNIALVNILAGEEIVPELIQGAFTPKAIRDQVLRLWHHEEVRNRMVNGLSRVKSALGSNSASRRTAQIAMEMVREVSGSESG